MLKNPIKTAYFFIAIAILLSAIYLQGLQNAFTNWDDWEFVTNNRLIQDISPENLKTIFTSFLFERYQPVAHVLSAIEHKLFGLNPSGYHAVSLLLHLANCFLVFRIIFLLSQNRFTAFATAALFAAHPLQVESVAWVSETKGLLAAFFLLGAMAAYIRYAQRPSGWIPYGASLLLFLLSVLSKAVTAVFPAVLFLLDYCLGRPSDKRSLLDKVPFFTVAVAAGMAAVIANRSAPAALESVPFDIWRNTALASYAVVFYLSKIFWPAGLSALYTFPERGEDFFSWLYFVCAAAALAMAASMFYLARRDKTAAFAAGFFLIMLAPFLQLIPIGAAVVANRYAYLASIGVLYGVAAMLTKAAEHGRLRNFAMGALFLAITALSTLSAAETLKWKNSKVLWTETIRTSPSVTAYINRGQAFEAEENDPESALMDYSRALEIQPENTIAYIYRGHLHAQQGRLTDAIEDFSRAVAIDPKCGMGYFSRGVLYLQAGRPDLALADFNKAIELKTNLSLAYGYRGAVLSSQGRNIEAIADFSRALRLEPHNVALYVRRAQAYFDLEQYNQSLQDLQSAEKLGYKPDPGFIAVLKLKAG